MGEGVNLHGEPSNLNPAEEKCDRSPCPTSFGQPGPVAPMDSTAAWCLARYGDVNSRVFPAYMLLNPRLDPAVAEWTVNPGFLLCKLLEFEWVVPIVSRHAVCAVDRQRFCWCT